MNARKPLELRIYPTPQPPGMTPEDEVHRAVWCADRELEWRLTQHKRLTDAELAAEYHAQAERCRKEQWIEAVRGDDYTQTEQRGQERMYAQLNTLYRFATHPHYDEADQ